MRLRADNLAAIRGGRRIFAGATFSVEAGEIAFLRGPNGSGKTTLLRVLAGLIRPALGEGWIGDAALSVDRDLYQERVGYAAHMDACKPAMTARETLGFWASFFGAPPFGLDARVEAALERFGVARIADEPTGRASAGQRRRISLARLLLLDRPVWLLDEPTASLDSAAARILKTALQEHAAKGGAALLAVHGDIGVTPDRTIDVAAFRATDALMAADPFMEGFEDDQEGRA